MKFLVITHTMHSFHREMYWAYGPYIREMNLWENHIEELIIVAPLQHSLPNKIDLPYKSLNINFISVPSFSFIGLKSKISVLFLLPVILCKIYKAMQQADHIHLRCPGNMGLLGAIVQIFFSKKIKTAKYAGNWDWNSQQPWSYRVQQKILRNTLLTKNMQTLVYGDWKETKNIKPFFTASYSEKEITDIGTRDFENNKPVKLIFVGALHEGKRPMLGLEVVKQLKDEQINCEMHFYGDGPERNAMEAYISLHKLSESIILHGNVEANAVKKAYQESHFLIFMSMSEGWPKVVAESMFWGCLPLTTAVSCVPEMVGFGNRGDIIDANVGLIVQRVKYYLFNPDDYIQKTENAMIWSRNFTLEKFSYEIEKVLIR
jgi:glycosyltransferase involved in cell wall biosynthesis